MDNQVRTELINLLCNYPSLATREGRDAWLLNLPSSVRNQIVRRHENCKIDLAFIIDAVQNLQLQDGRWPILILIDAVLSEAEGLAIAQKLSRLRQEIHRALEPPTGLDSSPAEEIIIGEDEKVSVTFLENGLSAARSVARIMVPRTIGGHAFGTSWLIAPGLLLTNYHVIQARGKHEQVATAQEFQQQAKDSMVWFGYDHDANSYTEYHCTEVIHANKDLDYVVLRIAEKSIDDVPLSNWGFLRIVRIQQHLTPGIRLNVIQHPGGRLKEIALRTNFYIGSVADSARFHYLSDTEGGSSGSPVLNDDWQVLGLHHAWDYYDRYYKDRPIRFNSLGLHYATPSKFSEQVVATVNEGILIHAILNDLPKSVRQEIGRTQGWA